MNGTVGLFTCCELRCCRYTVSKVISMIEDEMSDIESADIYMTRPSGGKASEGDSDDYDMPTSINHLSGRQLSAEAQVTLKRKDGTKIIVCGIENSSSETDIEDNDRPLTSLVPRKRKFKRASRVQETVRSATKRSKPAIRNWVKQDINIQNDADFVIEQPRLLRKDC